MCWPDGYAYREVAMGSLVAVPIDYSIFLSVEAKLLVRSGRPLTVPAQELLNWMLQRRQCLPRTNKHNAWRLQKKPEPDVDSGFSVN